MREEETITVHHPEPESGAVDLIHHDRIRDLERRTGEVEDGLRTHTHDGVYAVVDHAHPEYATVEQVADVGNRIPEAVEERVDAAIDQAQEVPPEAVGHVEEVVVPEETEPEPEEEIVVRRRHGKWHQEHAQR